MPMEEQKYFKQALSDFTYDAACGGAIRHLADLGYSVGQIVEQLSFPVPYERVQKTVWEYFLENGVLLLEEPGKGKAPEKADYVREYDKYGKASFRRVTHAPKAVEEVLFKEKSFDADRDGDFAVYLTKKCAENGTDAYVLLDFVKAGSEKGAVVESVQGLSALNTRQQDYIKGLLYQKSRPVYHRLNAFMRDIAIRLYESGNYHGRCYFIKTGEMIRL